jgi:hypothetical protein
MSGLGRRVAELLERKEASGKPEFSDEDVRDVVPLLCMGIQRVIPGIELPRFALQCVGAVAGKAGVDARTDAAAIPGMLAAYYASHSSPLQRALEAILREHLGEGGVGAARELAALLGGGTELKPLQSTETRPHGTTAAGPAARFQLLAKGPGSKKP